MEFLKHLYGGLYFHENVIYPLYKYRIDYEIYDALIEDLLCPELSFKDLALKYGLA